MSTFVDNSPNSLSSKNEDDAPFGYRLAKSLQWGDDITRLTNFTVRGLAAEVTQAFLGNEVAAVFVTHGLKESRDLLDEAALYAYHASAEWGIVTNANDLIIFNSHWVRKGFWYYLSPIPAPISVHKSLRQSAEANTIERRVLSLFTPEGIIEGRIRDATQECPQPEKILTPVDDALVDNLDKWRRESLRFTKSTDNFDANLQTLFAQLFVLRAVEDRNLKPGLPPLSSTTSHRRVVDVEKLKGIFELARDTIASDLFGGSVLDDIPDFVLGGIIEDLYHPSHLPGTGARYNFAWIDADVLGRAYQKYLSTLLVPHSVDSQMQLFEQPLREARLVSVQKKTGVYYTPSYMVRYLTELTLDEQESAPLNFSNSSKGVTPAMPRIADVSCGSGSFLTAAVGSIIRRLRQVDSSRPWGREIIENRCVIGIDTDPRAVTLARLSLWLRLAEEPDPLPLPSLNDVIVCGDSLREETWRELPGEYDAIVGNPPFLATGEVENRESLAQRFKVAQGRFDYSYLFVELAIGKLKPGGVLGLVVPNRLFKNRDAGALREMLTSECQLLSVADFTSTPVFARVGAYVGTLRARKLADNQSEIAPLRYIKVTSLPSTFISAMLLNADRSGTQITQSQRLAFDVAQPSGRMPWLFFSPTARDAHLRLEDKAQRLSSLALVRQGIKTGANDIYLVRVIEGDSSLSRIVNGFNEARLIETELLRPVVTGANLQRYDLLRDEENAIVYPYLSDGLIPESIFRERYSYAYSYLNEYRDILARRGSVTQGKSWYELSSQRDQEWLNSPKLLIRDLAQRISFALDDTGLHYCVGGSAVIPADSDLLLPLLAYLNSGLMNWYLSFRATVFQGNFFKFEPQHLNEIPVLPEVIEDGESRNLLEELCQNILDAKAQGDSVRQQQFEDDVDTVLCELAGISPAELQ